MRPRTEDSMCDDPIDIGLLKFTDDQLKIGFLPTLATLRKNRLFCDVILIVENTEIHAHRNVLACVSPYLMELFSADQEQLLRCQDGTLPSYRLNGGIKRHALQILVDYTYTADLEVPDSQVKDVYMAAWQLRMDRVVAECARHLIDELIAESCIETRSLPGITRNRSFVQEVDTFIAKEFAEVAETPEFLQLPCIQIDVLHQTREEMTMVTVHTLGRLVLEWIKRQLTDDCLLNLAQLQERSHMLYLALDNSLQDCSDLPATDEPESEIIQDYKRLALKCPTTKSRKKALAAPARPRVLIYSRDIGDRDEADKNTANDWNLIGALKVGDYTFISLVTLNGTLFRVSIQLRLNNSTSTSPIQTPDGSLATLNKIVDLDGTCGGTAPDLFCDIPPMATAKCTTGAAYFNGKLIVCGGYDRSECLKTVEAYCPLANEWHAMPSMREARGRFQIAIIDDRVYAVGGSNGYTELDTVECLAKNDEKWHRCPRLPLARSNAGVCSLNNRLFCIGGWNGQSWIRQCDVFTANEDKWCSISPLNNGRYQCGAAAFNGKIWAVGGSDAWNCLPSVEYYDIGADQWSLGAPLLTARRGCGLAEFNGKLYAVGGSDGTHSLNSIEVYDEGSQCWSHGPNMLTARSNVSVVATESRLYAIGGYSGKNFLNTIEYLDVNTNEWTTFIPLRASVSDCSLDDDNSLLLDDDNDDDVGSDEHDENVQNEDDRTPNPNHVVDNNGTHHHRVEMVQQQSGELLKSATTNGVINGGDTDGGSKIFSDILDSSYPIKEIISACVQRKFS